MAAKKVLYVDDESINLFLFEKMFDKYFDLICAGSGMEALEILKNDSNIGLVFADMNMPVMNGVEFIKEAKVDRPDISFLILTAYMMNKEISEAIDEGLIIECMHKPFDREKIVEKVNSLI